MYENDVIYIADLDQDIDDIIAAHYLFKKNVLRFVVCDPYPQTKEGLDRKDYLEKLGISVLSTIPPFAKTVFVGGALTLVAQYIKIRPIDLLVMNGGFVGCNIVKPEQELKKFKGKDTVRTYNFNCDALATDQVLRSTEQQIGQIVLVGKNVCHDSRNTRTGIWKGPNYKEIFDMYNVKDLKRQHDMLACHEGLSFALGSERFCEYEKVHPFNTRLNGKYTKWGSTKNSDTPYREVLAAVGYVEEKRTEK